MKKTSVPFRLGKRRTIGITLLLVAASAFGAYRYVTTPRPTDEIAGYELAERLGCHGCHGPFGIGGVPNPGSDEGEIPSWDGGTPMMYAETEDEIREWIMDGGPKRLADGDSARVNADGHLHTHPTASDSNAPPLRMPAFRSVINDAELALLVAYFKAMAAWDAIPDDARRGRREAGDAGCFGCHGPGGMIGSANARSFKGYIPPWHGKDFGELVKNERELRSWILDGSIPRFEKNPLARYFTRRQLIRMPAYRDVLTSTQVDDIVAYVQWLSKEETR